jgi:hypothetical protein
MKMIAGICLMFVALGGTLGWFLFGEVSGGVLGLFLAACFAVPFYCLTSVFRRNAAVVTEETPFQAASSLVNHDPSQLPRAAYEPHGGP